MNTSKEHKSAVRIHNPKTPVWQIVLNNIFGAAVRLHQYRDSRDALLRRVFLDYEKQLRDDRCCSE